MPVLHIILLLCMLVGCQSCAKAQTPAAPSAMREFRAVWVATVANIDWPSKPGLATDAQKKELLAILDKCVELNLNAVVFQIRPTADALYKSDLEPWSEYLTGKQGKAPEPFYDPLQFAVDEAHARGLEMHVWFNPYRARHPSTKGENAPNHVVKSRPDLAKKYGKHYWLDPGEPDTQKHSLNVILDVVKRYDIDGAHLDDYFYPYKENGPDGKVLDFPDEPAYKRYVAGGGKLSRDDWRRENVNVFVKDLYNAIKAEKKWVKLGISPFGIARPGKPEGIAGYDQYTQLYADAEKWLREGWLDYWTPQLYWRIDQKQQSYPVLLKWWASVNTKGRNFWPGNFTGKVSDPEGSPWNSAEIVNQIKLTRETPGSTGNVHFSMRAFMQNRGGISDVLKNGPYKTQALVPASPWLDSKAPAKPSARADKGALTGALTISWKPGDSEEPWQWVVYTQGKSGWTYKVLPGSKSSLTLAGVNEDSHPQSVMVSAVDRCGNESGKALVKMP